MYKLLSFIIIILLTGCTAEKLPVDDYKYDKIQVLQYANNNLLVEYRDDNKIKEIVDILRSGTKGGMPEPMPIPNYKIRLFSNGTVVELLYIHAPKWDTIFQKNSKFVWRLNKDFANIILPDEVK
jgi:hypothetical protein